MRANDSTNRRAACQGTIWRGALGCTYVCVAGGARWEARLTRGSTTIGPCRLLDADLSNPKPPHPTPAAAKLLCAAMLSRFTSPCGFGKASRTRCAASNSTNSFLTHPFFCEATNHSTQRTTMRTLLCVLLCLIAHVSAGRVTPAARSPAQRLRGNQPSRTAMHDDRRIARSDRVSLVATRRRAGDERAPKASNAECRGAPQRETRGRMMESPPRGADYRGCPRRCSGGMQCDMPSDSGMLACSF